MNRKNNFSRNRLTYQKSVDERMRRFFDTVDFGTSFLPLLKEYVLRDGKRMRGYLMTLGYRMCGGDVSDGVLSFSAGIELGHAGLLIQDDIFDHDMMRRGKPAFHIRPHGTEDIGQSIILSDLLVSLAYRMMLHAEIKPRIKKRALQYINAQSLRTISGEYHDINTSNNDPTIEEIETIAEHKTASYTTYATLVVGAILAEQPPEILHLFEELARDIGILFQLRDDFLCAHTTDEHTGKDVFSDFKEGRHTFLTYAIRSKVPNTDISTISSRKELFEILSGKEIHAAYELCTQKKLKAIQKNILFLTHDHGMVCAHELRDCVEYIINREK